MLSRNLVNKISQISKNNCFSILKTQKRSFTNLLNKQKTINSVYFSSKVFNFQSQNRSYGSSFDEEPSESYVDFYHDKNFTWEGEVHENSEIFSLLGASSPATAFEVILSLALFIGAFIYIRSLVYKKFKSDNNIINELVVEIEPLLKPKNYKD
eukprot:TRINITY_DN354_c2_g2_i2.p1 TRINITY_DN354_c2_g2~~TRINITY_DN354_c2_g2_i2.p1  ORF type:complete len:154 (-),score=40.67 TRINITY_DN354_c2_g2_i2:71-532(-)